MVWRNTLCQVMMQQPVITLGVKSFGLRDERKRVLLLFLSCPVQALFVNTN